MTVPGVNVIVAASFVAAIGDIRPLRGPAQAGRLFGSGPAGAPVRQRPGQPRADLQAGVGARPPRAGGVVLERGPPARPAARVLPARARSPRALGRHRRLRAQAGVPVLGPAHPRGGLRLRPALADPQEAAAARADRRRPALRARGRTGSGTPTRPSARPSASSQPRPRSPTPAPSATTTPPKPTKRARARHRDAHLQAVKAASSAARPQSQTLRFSSSSPTPNPNSAKGATNKSKRP